jgi:hypothetical protein
VRTRVAGERDTSIAARLQPARAKIPRRRELTLQGVAQANAVWTETARSPPPPSRSHRRAPKPPGPPPTIGSSDRPSRSVHRQIQTTTRSVDRTVSVRRHKRGNFRPNRPSEPSGLRAVYSRSRAPKLHTETGARRARTRNCRLIVQTPRSNCIFLADRLGFELAGDRTVVNVYGGHRLEPAATPSRADAGASQCSEVRSVAGVPDRESERAAISPCLGLRSKIHRNAKAETRGRPLRRLATVPSVVARVLLRTPTMRSSTHPG